MISAKLGKILDILKLFYYFCNMTKKERYQHVLDYFRQQMPEVNTELEFGSVFQLLVAVILSAQCTDKRVNQVTPDLFAHYPDAKCVVSQFQGRPLSEDGTETCRTTSWRGAIGNECPTRFARCRSENG